MNKNFYLQCSEFPKCYRFEGINSFHHFDFSNQQFLKRTEQYIYFSGTPKHHFFYTSKRLKQLIEDEILACTNYSLKKINMIKTEDFQAIIKIIERTPIDECPVSIEFTYSPLFSKLLLNNIVSNRKKKSGERYVEKVVKILIKQILILTEILILVLYSKILIF